MKLSAYGRTELARVVKVQVPIGKMNEVRTEMVLLSDRTLARKVTWLKSDGRVDFSSGWKRLGKVKSTMVEGWAERKHAEGWTVVKNAS